MGRVYPGMTPATRQRFAHVSTVLRDSKAGKLNRHGSAATQPRPAAVSGAVLADGRGVWGGCVRPVLGRAAGDTASRDASSGRGQGCPPLGPGDKLARCVTVPSGYTGTHRATVARPGPTADNRVPLRSPQDPRPDLWRRRTSTERPVIGCWPPDGVCFLITTWRRRGSHEGWARMREPREPQQPRERPPQEKLPERRRDKGRPVSEANTLWHGIRGKEPSDRTPSETRVGAIRAGVRIFRRLSATKTVIARSVGIRAVIVWSVRRTRGAGRRTIGRRILRQVLRWLCRHLRRHRGRR